MKKQKAITLISLVVTIIILIILVGVTINLSLGENGILSRARYAKEKYLNEQDLDEKRINELYSQILIATDDSSKITISVEDLRTIITEQVKETLKKENTSNVPAGTVISYITGTAAPDGYLLCDGSTYNISDYPELANSIKSGFGSYNYYGGDGTTTFAVPDLRGEFLRGTGTNSHTNQGSGENVGIHQDGSLVGKSTSASVLQVQIENYKTDFEITGFTRRYIAQTGSDNLGSAYTVRPTNTSVLYCIKY